MGILVNVYDMGYPWAREASPCVQAPGKDKVAGKITDALPVAAKRIMPGNVLPLLFQIPGKDVKAVDHMIVAGRAGPVLLLLLLPVP